MTNGRPSAFERVEAAARALGAHMAAPPEVALVLGSGLGAFADTLDERAAVPFSDVPGMVRSAVAGHAGNFVFGRVGETRVVAMQGRVHLYEGHSPDEVVLGARVMIALGAKGLVVTNAAGGIARGLRAGDLMVIDDHLNLTGQSCLVGPNDDRWGPRFVDMTTAYDAGLRELAHEVARGQGFVLERGVYAGLLGPTYETPAEIAMLRTLGASAVGMSTVLEVIAARHMGARVLGLSCITNLAAGTGGATLSHDEVQETATRVRGRFAGLLGGIVARMGGR